MGGLGFSPVGILVIAGSVSFVYKSTPLLICIYVDVLVRVAWNGISCLMMINCRQALQHMKSDGSWKDPTDIMLVSTYSEVAYAGLGKFGVYLADFCVAGSLLGIGCASQINFATLLSDLPSVDLSVSTLIVISAVICYPIACARDLSALSNLQLIGLICLLFNVAAVLVYGYLLYVAIPPADLVDSRLTLLPASEVDLSAYIGIACFCFGICTYIFPVEESMENTKDFRLAMIYCLVLVSAFYIIVGESAAILFTATTHGHISGNILLNLPSASFITFIARISMACICVLTYPLVLLPPSTMIENTINRTSLLDAAAATPITSATSSTPLLSNQTSNRTISSKSHMSDRHRSYSEVDLAMAESSKRIVESPTAAPVSWPLKALIRLVLCVLTTVFAAYVPCFGSVSYQSSFHINEFLLLD